MAFSANRKEEDEFVFCLEGQMYLETDETRAMTGVTERRDNTKGSGLFVLGSESDSNDDDNNDAEKRDTSNINNKEDKATTTTTTTAAAAIGLAQKCKRYSYVRASANEHRECDKRSLLRTRRKVRAGVSTHTR